MPPAGETALIQRTTRAAAQLYRSELWRRSVNSMLLALPVMAAFGSLLPVAGPFFGFRVMSLLVVLATLPRYRSISRILVSTRAFAVLALTWLAVGYASLLWATDRSASIKELFSVSIGLTVGIALLAYAQTKQIIRILSSGWTVAFALTAIVGIYERVSGRHLSNYLTGVAIPWGFTYPIATTFGNPDAYAAFLVTAAPFLLLGLGQARSRISRGAFIASLPLLLLLLLLTGSRVCLFAFFVQVIVAVVILVRGPYRLALVTVGGALTALVLAGAAAPLARALPFLPTKLFVTGGLESILRELSSSSGSGGQRVNLMKDGLWMTARTHGVGVGAGNFETTVLEGPYPTNGLVNPHSLWIEILSQYGVLVFLLYASWLAICLITGMRLLNQSETLGRPERALGLALVLSVVGNLVAVNAASSYLESSTNWVLIGSLGVLAARAETVRSRTFTLPNELQEVQKKDGDE